MTLSISLLDNFQIIAVLFKFRVWIWRGHICR
jgi:hypothetical protein